MSANEKDRGPMGAPYAVGSEKHQRVNIAPKLLKRYSENGNEIHVLQQSIAIDETWIRPSEPKLKRQSSEWHTKNSQRPVKFL